MNLEERYNSAPADSYVGKIRTKQAAEAGAIDGVNFMDGVPRRAPGPDEVQKEFTRNNAGDFVYGGGGKVAGTYALSRWLQRGVEKAKAYFADNKYTTIVKGDVRNPEGRVVHPFTPEDGKTFTESAILSEMAKGKINGSPAGPLPGGISG